MAVLAGPQSTQTTAAAAQPPEQGHAARNTALGLVALSVLPKPSPAQDTALTVTQIVQATTALLGALRRFQADRGQAFEADLKREALAEEPTLGDVIDNILSREMGFEATFRQKQIDRLQSELGPALSIADAKDREARIRALFAREKRYTAMREAAMRVRTLAAVRHYHLEQASPQGAYWMLGEGVKQHTVDCLAMAHHFWPWSVLHAFQPPVHHGCACKLLSLNEATQSGLMNADQIPDEAHAIQHATDLLSKAAAAMRSGKITEADIGTYLEGLRLEEARWLERFSPGTAHGGEFRPRTGGDPGKALLKRLGLGERGEMMHELLPSLRPLSRQDRGKWLWVKGRYMRIPHATDWARQIGGETYRSPAGTTNVYRDGSLLSTHTGGDESGRQGIHDKVLGALRGAIARASQRSGQPLRAGDGPEHVLAMERKGFVPRMLTPYGSGAWKISYVHDGTGQIANAVVGKDGAVREADWDTAPIPAISPQRTHYAPDSFRAHARDSAAWAHELGKRYGASVRLRGIDATSMLADHAGYSKHSGDVLIGSEAEKDIDRAARARRQGRPLTADELAGVWKSYWTMGHEIAHRVNPIHPEDYHGEAANLEEALAEENAHALARERLAGQGQHDVLRWHGQHPDDLSVRGVYREHRGALGDLLDKAGVSSPEERARVVEALKFEVDPRQRFRVLGAMIHQAHPAMSVQDGEAFARQRMLEPGPANSAVQRSPGLPPKVTDWAQQHFPFGTSSEKVKQESKPAPPPPPVVLGGDVPEPKTQGPIPTFRHKALAMAGKAFGFGEGAVRAKHGNESWIVREHHGDRNHVAQELLANAVYRALGIDAPEMGHVQTAGGPDFAAIPDVKIEEPPIPTGTRVSTGIIIREKNGKVTLIEPRNHFGGYIHTFPKGGMEPGLSAQQNAHKELWEETGLHAHIVGFVGDYKGDTGISRYYLAVRTGGEPTPSDETQAINTVTMKQATEMLNKPRDKEVLADVAKLGVPKGKFPDEFPPVVPGSGVAFAEPNGKKVQPRDANTSLGDGYMADALLGNWDFVGKYGDNLRWRDERNPIRVNHSSAFEYRPSGDVKAYGDVPEEVWSMLYRGQGQGTVALSEDDMRAQAKQLAKTLTKKKIDSLVDAAPFSDDQSRERIRKALKARVGWMRRFADGEIDLPQPAEGAEARALHSDAQRKFPVYPEEHAALESYRGPAGTELHTALRDQKTPSPEGQKMAKRLDAVLNDAKTAGDSYMYVGFNRDAGPSLVGQTVKQRSYTLGHTDRNAARGKTRIRVMVPGDSRAFHMQDSQPGEPDMMLPRGARLKVTALRKNADGSHEADAILLPYERPGPVVPPPAYKPKPYKPSGQTSLAFPKGEKPLPSSAYEKDDKVEVDLGILGVQKARVIAVQGGKLKVGFVDGTSAWQPPWKVRKITDDKVEEAWFDGMRLSRVELRERSVRAGESLRALLEADANPTGVMVALYPHPSTAKKFSLPGGEPAASLHTTLAFLGDAEDIKDPDGLKATVADWASRTAPMDGQISGHGLFTNGPDPVTYLSPDIPALPAARQDLVDSLDAAGHTVRKEHGFSPHMTVDYKDRTGDLPDHGGHKLRYSKAVLKIGAAKHSFAFGTKLREANTDEQWNADERTSFHAKHGTVVDGMGKHKDEDGYYIHTHRLRSKSYPSPDAIPRSVVEEIEASG